MLTIDQAKQLSLLITDYSDAYKTENPRLIGKTLTDLQNYLNSLIQKENG